MPDWANLPSDLVDHISKRLNLVVDYIRFRAVCKPWQTALRDEPQYLFFPWLVLNQINGPRHGVLSMLEADRKTYWLEFLDMGGKRTPRSSEDWFVFTEESPAVSIFNPLMMAHIQLPPFTAFPDQVDFEISNVGEEYSCKSYFGILRAPSSKYFAYYYLRKIILAENPVANNYTAVAIYGNFDKLAFCRPGYEKWASLEGYAECHFVDILCCKERVYAINYTGTILVFKIGSPEVVKISLRVEHCYMRGSVRYGCMHDTFYLVVLCEDLLLVRRHRVYTKNEYDQYIDRTSGFEVFRLELAKPAKWIMIKSLGDYVLVLGSNHSISLSPVRSPGYKSDCIYFTDDITTYRGVIGGHDVGIFSMKDGQITRFPYFEETSLWISPYPTWIAPSLC